MDAILIGYSGHGKVVLEAAMLNGINVLGYCDLFQKQEGFRNLLYLGNENNPDFNWGQCENYILGIGDNLKRKKLFEKIKLNEKKCLTIIHPDAKVSQYVKLGEGTFVSRGASINPEVVVGDGVILNTNSSVDHDCRIGDFSHIAPGTVLAGNVTIGISVMVGANSVVKESLKINDLALVGAGSTVTKNIESGSIVFGNPAKRRN